MPQVTSSRAQQRGYRGRVRCGCLTCRARKVKCDEARPVCSNCTRLGRQCVYKPLGAHRAPTTAAKHHINDHNNDSHDDNNHEDNDHDRNDHDQNEHENNDHGIGPSRYCHTGPRQSSEAYSSHVRPNSPLDEQCAVVTASVAPRLFSGSQDPFQSPDISAVVLTSRLLNALRTRQHNVPDAKDAQGEPDLPSTLISRDIELTTTMDLLAARSKPLPPPSSAFFLDHVDCPAITPFDPVNWDMMKRHILEIAKSSDPVSEAIWAVCAIYRVQLYAMCASGSLSLYRSAKSALQDLLNDHTQDFLVILVAAFLLCLFELIYPGELAPIFKEPSNTMLERLRDWKRGASTHSELSIRLVVWLRIIHRITLRGGGMGLISDEVCSLLPNYDGPSPNISPPSGYHPDVTTHLYQALSGPIFEFYYRLQLLSGEIAQLTHYHRSRITGNDQEEVVEHIAGIKPRLRALWDSRCATHCQTPDDLSTELGPSLADRIISLIGICDAAYHAELVEIDRVLGDPVFRWTDSRGSIQAIRDIVDASWEQSQRRGDAVGAGTIMRKLNPGYLRPLFLYAIECMDQELSQWAVDRMSQIQNPIYRSDFFAAFGKALSDAQIRKERRVTSKYFCHWYFGVSPPFM